MGFFGMGPMEILLILVIGFVFLGPERMVDAARLLGKAVREGRRLAAELPQVVIEDDDIRIVNYDASPSSGEKRDPAPPAEAKVPELQERSEPGASDSPSAEDGPVSFKPGDQAPAPSDSATERDAT
jgi:Sec-independent protein translocase protein TatA